MTVMYFGKSDPTTRHAPVYAVAEKDCLDFVIYEDRPNEFILATHPAKFSDSQYWAAFSADELIEFSGIPEEEWEFLSA